MTDIVFLLVTLVAFGLLALLVGVLDHADRPVPPRTTERAHGRSDR